MGISLNLWMVITVLLNIPKANGGTTALWDFCGCRWDDWQAWGDCDSECNGRRRRQRRVWLYSNKDGCVFAFTTCATNDMGFDYSQCNAFCYHGGTSNSYWCTCMTGYYGSCCGFQVDCGDPGSIANGIVHGTTFVYGANISYTCNNNYILINGSKQRTCQLNYRWSGTKPYCAYYDSCRSNPCKHGGTCNNGPDDYICICPSGWSGKDCDIDIQPPVIVNCSDDIHVETSHATEYVEWTIPVIFDPNNFSIIISSNYPGKSWTFPWGDFNVSFTALKPSNGLRNECVFQIQIRPYSCLQLPGDVPTNGLLACNGWRKDFGQFCQYMCIEPYTVPRGIDPHTWFVCGASGSWIPALMPNCSVNKDTLQTLDGYITTGSIVACTEDNYVIKTAFIEKLRSSSFGYFCDKFSDECLADNVMVKCV